MIFVTALLIGIFLLDPPWSLVVIAVGGIIEVAESLMWLWYSKRGRVKAGAETLIGATASVVAPCTPNGQVKIAGEIWHARCEPGADVGDVVRVTSRDGLTLLVEPET